MNKLAELKAAAEVATPIETDLYGDRYFQGPYSQANLSIEQDRFFTLANPATILKLIAVVEAVDALTDPEGNLPCIPEGPERRELEDAYRRTT